jgi:hypothetical protein
MSTLSFSDNRFFCILQSISLMRFLMPNPQVVEKVVFPRTVR